MYGFDDAFQLFCSLIVERKRQVRCVEVTESVMKGRVKRKGYITINMI